MIAAGSSAPARGSTDSADIPGDERAGFDLTRQVAVDWIDLPACSAQVVWYEPARNASRDSCEPIRSGRFVQPPRGRIDGVLAGNRQAGSIGTIAGVAAKFGVHRRVVRQALVNAVPAKHHYPERAKPKLSAVAAFIDEVLAAESPGAAEAAAHRASAVSSHPGGIP